MAMHCEKDSAHFFIAVKHIADDFTVTFRKWAVNRAHKEGAVKKFLGGVTSSSDLMILRHPLCSSHRQSEL